MVVAALATHAERVVDVLENDTEASVRAAAAKVLGRIGTLSSSSTPSPLIAHAAAVLIWRLQDADKYVRSATAAALTRFDRTALIQQTNAIVKARILALERCTFRPAALCTVHSGHVSWARIELTRLRFARCILAM